MWARLSDAELIESSNLIALGTLAKISGVTNTSDGQIRTFGVIQIDTVFKGDYGTKSVRINLPSPGTPVSSTDITYITGQKGLWFLRLLVPGDAAIYAADHPQRFVPLAQAGPQIKALKEQFGR